MKIWFRILQKEFDILGNLVFFAQGYMRSCAQLLCVMGTYETYLSTKNRKGGNLLD